jgi:hypothetical protein
MTKITISHNHGRVDLESEFEEFSDFQSLLYTMFSAEGQFLLRDIILKGDSLRKMGRNLFDLSLTRSSQLTYLPIK